MSYTARLPSSKKRNSRAMIITLDLTEPILSPTGEQMESGTLTLGNLLHFALRNVPKEKKERAAELRKRGKLIGQLVGQDSVEWDENTIEEAVAHCEGLFCQGDIQPLLEVYRLVDAARRGHELKAAE